MAVVLHAQRETVVDARRQNDQIVLDDLDANPTIVGVAHIEVAWRKEVS